MLPGAHLPHSPPPLFIGPTCMLVCPTPAVTRARWLHRGMVRHWALHACCHMKQGGCRLRRQARPMVACGTWLVNEVLLARGPERGKLLCCGCSLRDTIERMLKADRALTLMVAIETALADKRFEVGLIPFSSLSSGRLHGSASNAGRGFSGPGALLLEAFTGWLDAATLQTCGATYSFAKQCSAVNQVCRCLSSGQAGTGSALEDCLYTSWILTTILRLAGSPIWRLHAAHIMSGHKMMCMWSGRLACSRRLS